MRKTSKIKKQNLEELLLKMSIYFQDESSFEISQTVWRVLCPAWKKPIRKKWKEKRHDWISVSGVRWIDGEFYYKTSTSKKWEDFIAFLTELRKHEKKEWILVIVDNARIHHAKIVKEYCEENKIHLVYLPPYSPNLNPIELLRKMIKKEFRKMQRIYDDIEKSISSASELVKQRISKVCIESLVNVD